MVEDEKGGGETLRLRMPASLCLVGLAGETFLDILGIMDNPVFKARLARDSTKQPVGTFSCTSLAMPHNRAIPTVFRNESTLSPKQKGFPHKLALSVC
jgi:hypothetical protein